MTCIETKKHDDLGNMLVIRCVETKKYDNSGSILFIVKQNLTLVSTE
jgi:hypothetical protein